MMHRARGIDYFMQHAREREFDVSRQRAEEVWQNALSSGDYIEGLREY